MPLKAAALMMISRLVGFEKSYRGIRIRKIHLRPVGNNDVCENFQKCFAKTASPPK